MEIKKVTELKNILISALRYALPRHTYIVGETIDFIKEYNDLIDDRVKSVMLNDIENYLSSVENNNKNSSNNNISCLIKIDYDIIIDFYEWLKNFNPKPEEISIVSV